MEVWSAWLLPAELRNFRKACPAKIPHLVASSLEYLHPIAGKGPLVASYEAAENIKVHETSGKGGLDSWFPTGQSLGGASDRLKLRVWEILHSRKLGLQP